MELESNFRGIILREIKLNDTFSITRIYLANVFFFRIDFMQDEVDLNLAKFQSLQYQSFGHK